MRGTLSARLGALRRQRRNNRHEEADAGQRSQRGVLASLGGRERLERSRRPGIGGAVVVAEALPRTALEHGPTVAAATGPPELDSPHSGVPEGTLAPVTTWSAEAPKQLRTYFGI